jgi:signal transduction histidine kinase
MLCDRHKWRWEHLPNEAEIDHVAAPNHHTLSVDGTKPNKWRRPMLSLVESSKQLALRARCRRAAETNPRATSFEEGQCRTFTIDPFSTSIIHDLRNPLAAICASAEMLTDPHVTADHAKRLGRNIHKAADRMRALLADLASVTQGKLPAIENCNLHEVLAAACEDVAGVADTSSVDILLDFPARMEVALARTRMERVFINLITNALEAMPTGGKIRIRAREIGAYALIEVEDTGPGIPPEIYGRLFGPFVTARKKDGLGLGLALSRRTVRDHGGDMWSEPASGARFVIRLPLSRAVPRTLNGTR